MYEYPYRQTLTLYKQVSSDSLWTHSTSSGVAGEKEVIRYGAYPMILSLKHLHNRPDMYSGKTTCIDIWVWIPCGTQDKRQSLRGYSIDLAMTFSVRVGIFSWDLV